MVRDTVGLNNTNRRSDHLCYQSVSEMLTSKSFKFFHFSFSNYTELYDISTVLSIILVILHYFNNLIVPHCIVGSAE